MKPLKLYLYLFAVSLACQVSASAGQAIAANAEPAFEAQLVFSFGRAGQGATSTHALLSSVRGGTNRCELPGGTLEFFFFFGGHRNGKDIWTVGEHFRAGGTNRKGSEYQI